MEKLTKIILLLIFVALPITYAGGNFAYNRLSNLVEPIDVQIVDKIVPPIDLFFIQAAGAPTTLAENTSIDSTNVTLTDTTGFVDGTYVGIFNPIEDRFYFAEQLGAPIGNVIVLDTPIDFNYTAGNFVQPLTRDLNVDGSGAIQTFVIRGPGPSANLQLDITRIMLTMETDSAVSLSEFGDLPKLTRGLILRRVNGDTRNIWNVKSNGELSHLSFDYDPHQAINPAQGQDGANFRYSFNGDDKHGVIVRIGFGESLEILIQDDLSGLDSFRIIAEGHVSEG